MPASEKRTSNAIAEGVNEGRGARKRKSTEKAAASLQSNFKSTKPASSGGRGMRNVAEMEIGPVPRSKKDVPKASARPSKRAATGEVPDAEAAQAHQESQTTMAGVAGFGAVQGQASQEEAIAKRSSSAANGKASSKRKLAKEVGVGSGTSNDGKAFTTGASTSQPESPAPKPRGRKKKAVQSGLADQISGAAADGQSMSQSGTSRSASATNVGKSRSKRPPTLKSSKAKPTKATIPKQSSTESAKPVQGIPTPTTTSVARQIVPRRFSAHDEVQEQMNEESEADATEAPSNATGAKKISNDSGVATEPKPKKPRKVRKDKGIKRSSKAKQVEAGNQGSAEGVPVDPQLDINGPREVSSAGATKQKAKAPDDQRHKQQSLKRKAPAATERETTVTTQDGAVADEDTAPAKKRRKRLATPEDIEPKPIDSGATLMHELTKDVKVGRISEAETQLRTVDWKQIRKDKLSKHQEAMQTLVEETRSGKISARTTQKDQKLLAGDEADSGPATRLKAVRQPNGALAFVTTEEGDDEDEDAENERRHEDTATPTVNDRDVTADTASASAPPQVVLESKYTTAPFNTRTKIHDRRRNNAEREIKYKTNPWTEEDTEAFYSALSMWGTDFSIINALFPARTRRQIKLKFVREERADPVRVNRALIQETVPMDIGKFARMTGKEDGDFKEAKVIMDALDAEREVEVAKLETEKEEARKAVEAQRAKAKERQEAAAKRKRKAREGKDGARRKIRASEAPSEAASVAGSVEPTASKVRFSQPPVSGAAGRDGKRAPTAVDGDVDEDGEDEDGDGDEDEVNEDTSPAYDAKQAPDAASDDDEGDDSNGEEEEEDSGEGREIILGYDDEHDDDEY